MATTPEIATPASTTPERLSPTRPPAEVLAPSPLAVDDAAVAPPAAAGDASNDDLVPPPHDLRYGRGWLRWQQGQGHVLLWIAAIHVIAVVGLVLFPWPGWSVVGTSYALVWLGGLGTTVAYHRSLAHNSLRLNPVVEFVMIAFAIANGSGAPAGWAATHRRHHAHADTLLDVSSPLHGGFWWAHLRWLWQAPSSSLSRWAPDLDRPRYRFWTRVQPFIVIASLLIGLPFGAAACFWFGAIRLTYSLHGQCLINSAAHLGRRPDGKRGLAKDLPWLAAFHSFQGETWHAFHHARPSSARIGNRWWQIDVGWWVILALQRMGLARRVRTAK